MIEYFSREDRAGCRYDAGAERPPQLGRCAERDGSNEEASWRRGGAKKIGLVSEQGFG
jgi:hypothetical protein